MTTDERTAGRGGVALQVGPAGAAGVAYAELLQLARPCLGLRQQHDELNAEQAEWVRRRVDEAAAKGAT